VDDEAIGILLVMGVPLLLFMGGMSLWVLFDNYGGPAFELCHRSSECIRLCHAEYRRHAHERCHKGRCWPK
jgi:hypothetical protein